MTENDVRQMLQRRAGDVSPSPDAWADIERRLTGEGGDGRVVPLRNRPARRYPPFLVAAAVLVALGVAAAVLSGPDGSSRVDTTPASPSPTAPPTTFGGSSPSLAAVWPATTVDGLNALQADADAGRRPDLLNPRAAAGQYLGDRFLALPGERVDFEVLEYRAGDSQSGEVPYRADGLPGTVLVRRTAGEGSIWFVVGSTSLRLPVVNAGYDGRRFTAGLQPTAAGRLEVALHGGDGDDPVRTVQDVTAGQQIELDQALPGRRAAIALMVHTGTDGVVSLAEVRADGPAPIRPAYCEVLDSVMGERPESYVGSEAHLADIGRLQGAADPAIMQELKLYYDFVVDEVSPADPPSQEVENWPQPVRDALQRIDAHDSRLCRSGP